MPDIEKYDMFGAGCSFAPGKGIAAVALLQPERGFMKIDGGVVRFRSSGCAVNFDKEGIPQGSSGRCSSAQEREAAKIYNKARILRQSIDQKGSGA